MLTLLYTCMISPFPVFKTLNSSLAIYGKITPELYIMCSSTRIKFTFSYFHPSIFCTAKLPIYCTNTPFKCYWFLIQYFFLVSMKTKIMEHVLTCALFLSYLSWMNWPRNLWNMCSSKYRVHKRQAVNRVAQKPATKLDWCTQSTVKG